ncbi:MAG: NADH-quinone oxidoreductase subunit N [Bryobacterales bacterium]|nr:NADH-quinone oxidoreductase subunit N [Bryobacterales bacterium]
MTGLDFIALLPLLILAAATVIVMLAIAIHRCHALSAALTFVGLGASFGSLWISACRVPCKVTPLLLIDRYSLFYMGLITVASLVVVLLSYGYFEKLDGDHDELYILMLVATLGSAVLVSSNHFISFFLGLELLSVPLYGMIAYTRRRPLPLEAGVKYLVLAAVSATFMLFGMALVYGALGTMRFDQMATQLVLPGFDPWLVIPGLTLIITGFGFKLALAPFHIWTPDIYQGAPAPVAAYVATISKGAMFALLLRYFYQIEAQGQAPVMTVFAVIAIVSMCAGNILALLQDNVKRILAYSSIAHLGYLVVAFQASGQLAIIAVGFYLVAYFITMLGAFGIVAVLSGSAGDADSLSDYRGLFWRRPVVASVFTLMLFSLAGIPVTAGFIGKFYIVAAGASVAMWSQIIVLVVTSAIGLFYYLRIVVAIFSDSAGSADAGPAIALPGSVALGFLTAALVFLGVYPQPLLGLIRSLPPG